MRVINNKVFFYGSSEVFSNWYRCKFTMDDIEFNCSEQAMMYYKAMFFNDSKTAEKIIDSKNPKEQKLLGRIVIGFDEKIWAEVREQIVYNVLKEKFTQNEKLKQELLKYKDCEFVEASPYDIIWGIGLPEDNDLILDKTAWKGQNLLGKCLTKLKDDLIKIKS